MGKGDGKDEARRGRGRSGRRRAKFHAGPEKRVPFFPALPVIDVTRERERDIIIP